jgi:hypothetical protein
LSHSPSFSGADFIGAKEGQNNKFQIGTLEKIFPDYRAFYCTLLQSVKA